MSGFGAAEAETLTLVACISPIRVNALAGADAFRKALADSIQGIPASALQATRADWNAAFQRILAIPVGEMFKAACLTFAVDAPKDGVPDAEGVIPMALMPFVIESSHQPTIVISGAGVVVNLKFDLQLSLEVSGAELLARDGAFVGARTGTSKGVARISFLNLDPPLNIGSPEFELPGTLDFNEPVRM